MWVEGQNGTGSGAPLTPSNSTPAAIVSDYVYEAQGNGYAIESYNNVTIQGDRNATQLRKGNIYKIADALTNIAYAYGCRMPYVDPKEIYTELVRNRTAEYPLRNGADGPEGIMNPLNYWLLTAVFRTTSSSGTATYGGTWLVVGSYAQSGAYTLVELQKDSTLTNLTVALKSRYDTYTGEEYYYLEVKSTATVYYHEIRIIRLTDNR